MATSPAPVRADERIDTLDLLRGVAICGILLMNIPSMGAIGRTHGLSYPAAWNADWITWGLQSLFFEGTMRGLFTMLFGAGMLIMLRRTESDGEVAPIDVWSRRCYALMALGVVQAAVFLWPGEILFTYGLTGLFLLAFRRARPRTLLIVAAILFVAQVAYDGHAAADRVAQFKASIPAAAAKAAGKPLTDDQKKAIEAVAKARESTHPTAATITKERVQRTHLPSVISWSFGQWKQWNIDEDWWAGIVESSSFMLVGMALLRMGVLSGGARGSTYLWLMLIGYGGGLTMHALGLLYQARFGFDVDPAAIVPVWSILRNASYQPARLLITLGHVGLLITLFRVGVLGRAWPIRAMGRMALTVYSLESILTSILFYGFGTVGAFGFAALMGIAAGIWIVCGFFCLWWLKSHEMGPMERLLRKMAYGTMQGRRRRAAEVAMMPVPAV